MLFCARDRVACCLPKAGSRFKLISSTIRLHPCLDDNEGSQVFSWARPASSGQ